MAASATNPFETNLDRNTANFAPLSPLSLIARTAAVYPDRCAVIHDDTRATWAETYGRCRRLASALIRHGIGKGDTVSLFAANVPAALEAHFGVPMTGAVLNAINIRLDAATVAFILGHAEAKLLFTDREFSGVVSDAVALIEGDKPTVIDIDDQLARGGELIGETDYETFIAGGDAGFAWSLPDDEWQSLSLNYTSGTTGNPKGVVYSHRGAYMNAISNLLAQAIPPHPIYLWTLPMFHCNGWCFPWTITALAGTHVCLRRVETGPIFDAIAEHEVTHFCGAPIVLNMLANASDNERRALPHKVDVMTAGASPPAAVLESMESQGFHITHAYGLTETYGPDAVCAWHPEWDDRPAADRAALKARQGVRYHLQEGLMVADPETLEPVPRDGEAMGEIFHRGNIVMKGYLKNPAATEEAFRGGWFHSGDLAVWHEDGYIEIKDRSKDIIISGGENISSIEIEDVLYRHPAVLEAAVAARPDEKWGETPCAFVTLKAGAEAGEDDIIAFCRDNMAHYKAPGSVVFCPLPKTSTGKIQKFILRERAKELGSLT